MSIYDTLNPMQKEAVFHTEGPLLILAGARSGKTPYDPPGSVSDPGKTGQSVGSVGHHLYR